MIDAIGAFAVWGGMLLVLIGAVFFIVQAFRCSILWGLAVLFLPFAHIAFLIVEWDNAKRPFFWQLYGIVLILVGALALSAPIPFVHHH